MENKLEINTHGCLVGYDHDVLDIENLVIPEEVNGIKVTEIGSNLFSSNYLVKSVVLPKTVRIIHSGAFCRCEELEEINLEDVQEIDAYAFMRTKVGGTIEKPLNLKNCERIEHSAFRMCDEIEGLELGDNVHIGYRSFYLCENLKKVVMGNTCEVQSSAFTECSSLKDIIAGNYCIFRSKSVADNISLEAITIGNSAEIEEESFLGCKKLHALDCGNRCRIEDNFGYLDDNFRLYLGEKCKMNSDILGLRKAENIKFFDDDIDIYLKRKIECKNWEIFYNNLDVVLSLVKQGNYNKKLELKYVWNNYSSGISFKNDVHGLQITFYAKDATKEQKENVLEKIKSYNFELG